MKFPLLLAVIPASFKASKTTPARDAQLPSHLPAIEFSISFSFYNILCSQKAPVSHSRVRMGFKMAL